MSSTAARAHAVHPVLLDRPSLGRHRYCVRLVPGRDLRDRRTQTDDWQGDWIGADSQPGPEWTDYTVDADVTLTKDALGVFFRGRGGLGYMWQLNQLTRQRREAPPACPERRRRLHRPGRHPAEREPQGAPPPAHHRRRPVDHHLDRRRPGRQPDPLGPQRARPRRLPHQRRRGRHRPQPQGHQREQPDPRRHGLPCRRPDVPRRHGAARRRPSGEGQHRALAAGQGDPGLPQDGHDEDQEDRQGPDARCGPRRVRAEPERQEGRRPGARAGLDRLRAPDPVAVLRRHFPRQTRQQQHRGGGVFRLVRGQPGDVRSEQVRVGDLCHGPTPRHLQRRHHRRLRDRLHLADRARRSAGC